MISTIAAIYEDGVFKPAEPVDLDEGTLVQIELPILAGLVPPGQTARLVAEIAKLSTKEPKPFGGSEHDKAIYDRKTS